MVRPPRSFVDLAQKFVCVRVTNMTRVDLSLYRFDYDLTFAVLTMRDDGLVYHRFGGRNHTDPAVWLSMGPLLTMLQDSLDEHSEGAPRLQEFPPTYVTEIPPMARKLAKKKIECIHCHTVNEALRADAQERNQWSRRDIWLYPPPERVGLEMDPGDQSSVRTVGANSPAAKAGFQAGDRLKRLGPSRISTINDIQWVLHEAHHGEVRIPAIVQREGQEIPIALELEGDWKIGNALTYSWRPSKWELLPAPGFGGPILGKRELASLGLPEDQVAFRVTYLVTWGDRPRFGHAAIRAGIRNGDVVLSLAGKSFENGDHFHSRYRLEAQVGSTMKVEILRGKKRQVINIPVIE